VSTDTASTDAILVASRTDGIVLARRDRDGWSSTTVSSSPASALAIHPARPIVYAVLAEPVAGVLRTIDLMAPEYAAALPSGGVEPCHVAVDPRGRVVVVANYGSGAISAFPLDDRGTPSAGVTVELGAGSHPHQAVFVDDRRFLVPDLGADRIRVVDIRDDADGLRLEVAVLAELPAGAGPRHLVALGGGGLAVAAELGSEILAERPDGWESVPATTRPSRSGERNYPGDIARLGADTVAVANRGADTVAIVELGAEVRVTELPAGARWPQHLLPRGDRLLIAGRDDSAVWSIRHGEHGWEPAVREFGVAEPMWLLDVTDRTDVVAAAELPEG
jgi:6-phosphogluconolactonase